MPAILVLGRLRQGDQQLEVRWATDQDCRGGKKGKEGRRVSALLGDMVTQTCHLRTLDTEARDRELKAHWDTDTHR